MAELTSDECRTNSRILRMQAARHQDHNVKDQMIAVANEYDQLAMNIEELEREKSEPR
jgi:hypothetical protein